MFKGLKSLAAGLLAGTALGILFSPKKGKEIRKGIKNEIEEGGTGLCSLKETVLEMGKEIGDTCKECYTEVKNSEEFSKGKETLKKAYKENVPKKARKTISEGISKAKKTVEKVKKAAKKK
jgi:gas vesicle protein